MSHKKKLEVQIEGMTCGSCEILIERKFKKIPGVKSVKVSQLQGKAMLYCDQRPSPQVLQEAIAADGYKVVVDGRPVQEGFPLHKANNTFKDYCEMSAMVLVVFGLYLIFRQFNLFGTGIGITENMDIWFVLLIGLVAGTSSCIAVTGGVLLSVAAKYNQNVTAPTCWQKFKPHLYFNVGRIISYTVLGGVLGFIGSKLTISPMVTGVISLIASAFMILMGLNILNLFPGLGKLMPKPPKFLSNKILDLEGKTGKWVPFTMGALTFFLPCGFTQSLQILVLSKGDWLQGALTMMLFSLGTLPALLSLSAVSSFAKGGFQRYFLKFSGVLVLIIGMSNISNGFALLGINGTAFANIFQESRSAGIAQESNGALPKIENGKQIVNMTVEGYQYKPNRFTVYQGIPVEWRIDGRKAEGCGRVLTMPFLGITEFMPQDSIKSITFTPKDVGTYSFNCTMGMMTPNSAFVVIPNTGGTSVVDQGKLNSSIVLDGVQKSSSDDRTVQVVPPTGNVQKVRIDVTTLGFEPELVTVKRGIPVEVTVDVQTRLSGCMSVMVIPAFDVSKSLQMGINTFTFTPDKTGEFDVICPMGIKETTIRVID